MKKTKYLLGILALGLSFQFSACSNDFLTPENPGGINSDDVWKDKALITAYVNKIYNERPGWDYNVYNNISDEARSNYPGGAPNQILIGQWDEVNNPMSNWKAAYTSIRRMNEFFTHISSAQIDNELKTKLSGEVYFLRAFMYFDLVKRYGGVPLLKDVNSINDDLQVERGTLEESFQFIVSDLDQAIAALPSKTTAGRASKEAAIALKGRVLLYWASPLYNTNNDPARWTQAAQVNKELMDLKTFSLYDDLGQLWLAQSNAESIFQVEYALPEKYHSWDALLKPLVIANNDAGQCSPLQNLVDAFPMANGKSIDESGSGYNDQDPYVGRDKRFYWFIAYNGAKMKGTTSGPPVKEITLQIYSGGRDYDAEPSLAIYNTITGYYTVKAVDPENTIYRGGYGSTQPWIELRYAEVLLNYAEAKNESAATPDQSVYDAVNLVRKRAGINTPIAAGSYDKSKMRELIRNERYVEFCFEGKRYWDLRRWKIATATLNNKKGMGVIITKNGNNFSYSYQPIDPQNMVFQDKMYFMPIPQSELTKNGKLEQNPGW